MHNGQQKLNLRWTIFVRSVGAFYRNTSTQRHTLHHIDLLLGLPLNNYCVFIFMNDFVARFQSLFSLSYYCTVYSAIQPLKAASVLSEISCRGSDSTAASDGRPCGSSSPRVSLAMCVSSTFCAGFCLAACCLWLPLPACTTCRHAAMLAW